MMKTVLEMNFYNTHCKLKRLKIVKFEDDFKCCKQKLNSPAIFKTIFASYHLRWEKRFKCC